MCPELSLQASSKEPAEETVTFSDGRVLGVGEYRLGDVRVPRLLTSNQGCSELIIEGQKRTENGAKSSMNISPGAVLIQLYILYGTDSDKANETRLRESAQRILLQARCNLYWDRDRFTSTLRSIVSLPSFNYTMQQVILQSDSAEFNSIRWQSRAGPMRKQPRHAYQPPTRRLVSSHAIRYKGCRWIARTMGIPPASALPFTQDARCTPLPLRL